jgi:hypothetical protein
MKVHHPCWNFVLVFLIFCWSCEIEDERGTFDFMVKEELPESVYGKILENNYPCHDRFIVNEDDQEIYFCNCPTLNSPKNIISSLNYISGESKEIYRSTNLDTYIDFVRYSPATHKLFFLDGTHRFLDGTHRADYELIMVDVRSLEKEVISGNDSFKFYDNVVDIKMNDNYFFYTDNDDSVCMKEIFGGNAKKILKVKGWVRHAASDTPEIVVSEYHSGEHKIYNYQLDSITFQRNDNEKGYPTLFYDWNGEIYYYDNSGASIYTSSCVIKQFKTGNIIFGWSYPESNSVTEFAGVNLKCNKCSFIKEERYSQLNYNFGYINSRIIIKDMLTGDFTVPVSIYSGYGYGEKRINRVILLDNCNTVIYLINTKFYVSSF